MKKPDMKRPEAPKTLRDLLQGIEPVGLSTGGDIPIYGVSYDSRQVRPGHLFVCIQGFSDDGHRYIPDALQRGAAALVVERAPIARVDVPIVRVADARKALALLADRFYDHPSSRLTLVGITGTQGKTTTAYLTEAVLRAAGLKTGLIGTVVKRVGSHEERSLLTTPESADVHRLLAESVRSGLTHVAMEVSSHALALNRVAGCDFTLAVFTNCTSDHLDLHGSVDKYLEAKIGLFAQLGLGAEKCAIVNVDDAAGRRVLAASRCRTLTYGIEREALLTASRITARLKALDFIAHTPQGQLPVHMRLTGRFNVYNALAAVGVGLSCGLDLKTIARGLESVTQVPGRFEVLDAGQDFLVIVDFAHTAAAMEQLLLTARALVRGRLIVVFGCPGARDKTKRPMIGATVARLSDYAIVTTDNPASENPGAIAREIEPGLRRTGGGCAYEIMLDRAEAIARALTLARPGDAVLLAGKGHEEYQIMASGLVPFSDRDVALAYCTDATRGHHP